MDVGKRKGREMTERKPHKWAEVIKAWADGKPIQFRQNTQHEWTDWIPDELKNSNASALFFPFDIPRFDQFEWRVKPEITRPENITFTLKCKMRKEWKGPFVDMLKRMQYLGGIGSSRMLSFYSDGDGSFNPVFELDGVNLGDVPVSGNFAPYDATLSVDTIFDAELCFRGDKDVLVDADLEDAYRRANEQNT